MRYQVIESKIWNDEHFIKLTPMQQRLFLYLLTCPHGNFLGLFVLKPAYAVGDLGQSEDEYLKDLNSLDHFIKYDENTSVLWIKNLLRYGTKAKLNEKQKAGAMKLISELPKSELIEHFINYYKSVLGDLSISHQIGVSKDVSNGSVDPYGITDTDTETETNTDTELDTENTTSTKEESEVTETSLSSGFNNSSSHSENNSKVSEDQAIQKVNELNALLVKQKIHIEKARKENKYRPSQTSKQKVDEAIGECERLIDEFHKARTRAGLI